MSTDLEKLRQHCLERPGAVDGHPFGSGVLVIKVGGKIFAILAEDANPLQVSLKCEPEIAVAVCRKYAAVKPGYHLNKRHWNTVTLDGSVDDEQVLEWVDDSYDLVFHSLPATVRNDIAAEAKFTDPTSGP